MELTTQLTPDESTALQGHEATITANMDSAMTLWAAIRAIKDGRLYRASHKTFEAYCEAKFGMSKSRARQLIQASAITEQLPSVLVTIGNQINERQARELAKVEPEKRVEVLEKAQNTAKVTGKPVTAKAIKEAAAEVVAPPKPKGPPKIDTDKAGRIVTDQSVKDALAQTAWFEDIATRLHAIKRAVIDQAALPIGRELRTQDIERSIKDAVAAVRWAMPHTTCGMKDCKKGSKCCDGSRWVNEAKWDSMPVEVRVKK